MTYLLSQKFNAFARERAGFSLQRSFRYWMGSLPNTAVPKDEILERLADILPVGYITPVNAAAFLSAIAIKHVNSRFDPVNYLERFLTLYNAKDLKEVAEAESFDVTPTKWKKLYGLVNTFKKAVGIKVPVQKSEWETINRVYVHESGNHTKRMDTVRIYAWLRDMEEATKGTFLGRLRGNHKPITADEAQDILKTYVKPKAELKRTEPDGTVTNSAFDKTYYLPLLRKLRGIDKPTDEKKEASTNKRKEVITETQCGILLCFILHSTETRRDKVTSYITHPMAVANLVRKYGPREKMFNAEKVWQAVLAALLHDSAEESNIDLENDLNGLLPERVIASIKLLHKIKGKGQPKEPYYHYIERLANDPLAAFVKLCDIWHNSSDTDPSNPDFKQAYVYPIAANYLRFRLDNPRSKISIADFVVQQGICTAEVFANISRYADEKIIGPDGKKRQVSVSEVRGTLGTLKNITPIKDLFPEEPIDADPRRNQELSLLSRANV